MGAAYNEDWTVDVVGRMHRLRITNLALAERSGYSAAYLSTVLNGGKQFESEDAKQRTKDRIIGALSEIEKEIEGTVHNAVSAN